MAKNNFLTDVIGEAPNRRSFLTKIAIAGAAAAAVNSTAPLAQAQAITDADILQFALNLEYLEAEFYTVGTTGRTISQLGIGVTGSGTAGATTGGAQINFSNNTTLSGDVANRLLPMNVLTLRLSAPPLPQRVPLRLPSRQSSWTRWVSASVISTSF